MTHKDEIGRDDIQLPGNAGVAMTLVWRLGCLSTRHAALLWPYPVSKRAINYHFYALTALGYLVKYPYSSRYAPFNNFLLDGRPGRSNWEYVYVLSKKGLKFAAEYLELHLPQARAQYNRTHHPYRNEHVYLRSEAYALLAKPTDASITIHRLEGEGGVGRVRLPERPGHGRRWVEPDGLIEVEELSPTGAFWNFEAPAEAARWEVIIQTILVEIDTGSQSHVDQIAAKVDGYSEWYLAGGSPTSDIGVSGYPPVLFISPKRSRSLQVHRFIEQHAERRPNSPLWSLDRHLRKEGFRHGALEVFCTTNLQTLRAGGSWRNAFTYLHDEEPGPLF